MQVGCLATGIDAQATALESERATQEAERVKALQVAKSLRAAMATISKQDGDLNAAQATLVTDRAQALADIVVARANAEAEVAAVRALAEKAATITRDEAKKTAVSRPGATENR